MENPESPESPMDDDLSLLLPDLDLDLFVDDDPEVLRAALDFIEACDASDSSSSHESDSDSVPLSPLPSQSEPEPKTDAPKPRRVTRNRRKEEIAELRVLVADLEQQLSGRKRKLHIPETLPFALGDNAPLTPDINVVWEHISKRQQQQRQLAELENIKLRSMVMDQLKIARELTRQAKRRAILEGRAEGADVDMADANESPLMVRIYPTRPSMPVRVGMAMPLSNDVQLSQTLDDRALEGTPVGAAWKSSAITTETSQATRVVWQSALRQFLKRRRAACCHERVEDIIESAMTANGPTKSEKVLHEPRGLVYTDRYEDGLVVGDDKTAPMPSAWLPNVAWQSPSALLTSLLSPTTKKTVNLRLFRLEKPKVSDDMEDVMSRLDGLSLHKPSSPNRGTLQTWQRASLRASSCF